MSFARACTIAAAVAFALAAAPADAQVKQYRIDPSHAAVTFKVSHLGFSDTLFQFRNFDAEIWLDPDDLYSDENSVRFVIDAASLDSNWERRDDHVRSDDFLDVGAYPEIVFTSTGIEPAGETVDGEWLARLYGVVEMLGGRNEAVFVVKLIRRGEFRGKEVIGFEATGILDRTRFGVDFGAPAIGAELDVWISLEISPV